MPLIRYLAALDYRKVILWTAFFWYAAIVSRYGVGDPAVWWRALGIGLLVGAILTLNTVPPNGRIRDVGIWPIIRFFVIPFCVSSFSALTKGRDFFLIFPPNMNENAAAAGVVLLFGSGIFAAKWLHRRVKSQATDLKLPSREQRSD